MTSLPSADPRYAHLKVVHVARDDRLLTITLNRPHALNAVGDGLHEELEEALLLARNDAAAAILLTGAGRAFCAGADLKELNDPSADGSSEVARVQRMVAMARTLTWAILDLEQPIVAAVHGYAMGMGATIALFADIVLAAEDAVFADNHVNAGLVAGDGGTVIWPMLVPITTAKYYLLTGERIDGREAERIGLVFRAYPADELLDRAREVATRLSQGAPLAVHGTKRSLNKQLRERVELLLDPALTLEGLSFLSDDHKEASRAFVEKRDPVFRGL